ncbi:MAG TPA: hypothetical protein VEL28_16555 [Candidatus Binatia bacterium]|nr:hypothetical protein [Candidatus Binatia bacterium]
MLPASASATFRPAGPEIRVNVETAGNQFLPNAAVAPSGRFLVVWRSVEAVRARLFSPQGQPLTGEIAISDDSTYGEPDVAALADGRFLVTWLEDYVLQGQRIDADGRLVGGRLPLSDGAGGREYDSHVAALDAQRFIVVWSREFTETMSVHARIVDPDDPLAASEIEIREVAKKDPVNDSDYDPRVVTSGAGGFLVSWTYSPSGDFGRDYIPQARLYGNDQQPLTDVFPLVETGETAPSAFKTAIGPAGDLSVVMSSGYYGPVVYKRYDAAGTRIGSPQIIYDGEEDRPPLHVRGDGSFFLMDRSAYPSVMARPYDAAGAPSGEPFSLADDLTYSFRSYEFEFTSQGSMVVALDGYLYDSWPYAGDGSEGPDGSYGAVYVRRFCADGDASCAVCPAFDDSVDGDFDGVPDGCDLCTNNGAQDATAARTFASYKLPFESFVIPKRDNRMEVVLSFALPAGVTGIGELPVVASGMRVRIESIGGGAVADVVIPGGTFAGGGTAGWQVKPGRLRYVDRTDAPVNGVRRVSVSPLPPLAGRARVRVQVTGRAGVYADDSAHLPLRAVVSFGGTAGADAGLCGEAAFSIHDCSADTAIRCSY